jgi:CubicO group peptidase (beta-lactamase class C family)
MSDIIATGVSPGLSLTLFDASGVFFGRAVGKSNADEARAVASSTVFEAASLSKTVCAYLVAVLVREGVIGFDTPLHQHLPPSILGDDRRRRSLTPRMLLSHRSDLPDWRGPRQSGARSYDELFSATDILAFLPPSDTLFNYSGEGYLLLQRALEAITGLPFEQLARQWIFLPLGMYRSRFTFEKAASIDYAVGHDLQGRPVGREDRFVPIAAGTLSTTAHDYGLFLSHLVQQRFRWPTTALLHAVVTADLEPSYRIDWGLGVGLLRHNQRTYYFHWGDNGAFQAYYLYGVDDRFGFVYFANSGQGLSVAGRIAACVFGRHVPIWPSIYRQV